MSAAPTHGPSGLSPKTQSCSRATLAWRSLSKGDPHSWPGLPAALKTPLPAVDVVPQQGEGWRGRSGYDDYTGNLVREARQGLTAPSATFGKQSSVKEAKQKKFVANPAGKAFVKALRTCSSLAELRGLMFLNTANLDCQAVTALASHLADRASPQGPHHQQQGQHHGYDGIMVQPQEDTSEEIGSFMRCEWLPLFRHWLPLMDASGICICVQSSAKVTQQLQQSVKGTASFSEDQLEIGEFSLKHVGGATRLVMDEFDLDEVMQAVDSVLHSFSARSAVQLLWGMVSQKCRPPAAWLARFLACTLPGSSLPKASPRDLATLLWCLAKLKRKPPERWTGKLIEASQAKITLFDAQQLGMTLWALAVLRVSPGDGFIVAAVNRAEFLLLASDGRTMSTVESEVSLGKTSSVGDSCLNHVSSPSILSLPGFYDVSPEQEYNIGRYSPGSDVSASHQSQPLEAAAAAASSSAVSEIWRGVIVDWQDQLSGLPAQSNQDKDPEKTIVSPLHQLGLGAGQRPSDTNGLSAASLAQVCYGIGILNHRNTIPNLSRAVTNFIARPVTLIARPVTPVRENKPSGDLKRLAMSNDIRLPQARCPLLHQTSAPPLHLGCISASLHSPICSDAVTSSSDTRDQPLRLHRQGESSILSVMGSREIMMLLIGLSNFGCRPRDGDVWIDQVLGRLKLLMGQTHSFQSGPESSSSSLVTLFGLAGTLWCLAQMGVLPPTGWMHEAERCLVKLIARYGNRWNPKDSEPGSTILASPLVTSRLLAAFGAMGYRPKAALGACLVDSLCYHLSEIPAKQLLYAALAILDLGLPVSPYQLMVVRSVALRTHRHRLQ